MVSEPDDPTAVEARRVLAACPRPELSAVFARNVVARVMRETARPTRALGPARRLALAAAWLAVIAAWASILAGLPWPTWLAALAWGLAMAATPVACAAVLFPRVRPFLAVALLPLLPRLDPGAGRP